MTCTTIDPDQFRSLLLDWYQIHQRALPWRTTKDPYKIWLSEIILQQTRVAQGLPYYERFVKQYPVVEDLARATEQDLLHLWQGLGYYSRARNLLHCARTIVAQYGGKFPTSYKELTTLKGIGSYTAAAIAAVAFKEVVSAVDGNVYRVLSRLFGLMHDISTTQGRVAIQQLANLLVDPLRPDTYSQAIMDFGALHCKPKQPLCTTCIFKKHCVAYQASKQDTFPIKTSKLVKRIRYFDYIVLEYKQKLYMKKRAKGDIWQGMYDFYLIENEGCLRTAQHADPLLRLIHDLPTKALVTPTYETTHLLTHQRLFVRFHQIAISNAFLNEAAMALQSFSLQPFSLREIEKLPKPILIQKFLRKWIEKNMYYTRMK